MVDRPVREVCDEEKNANFFTKFSTTVSLPLHLTPPLLLWGWNFRIGLGKVKTFPETGTQRSRAKGFVHWVSLSPLKT